MVKRYLAAYGRRRPLDRAVLRYYEAASCMRGLVRAAERRLQSRPGDLNPLDASSFGENLAAHFASITGILPSLPAPPNTLSFGVRPHP